jgi:hypothetical protein
MLSMKRYHTLPLTGLLVILMLICDPATAKVSAILSSTATGADQPVRLTLQSDGEQEMSPDLSELEQRFEILGRSTQQSISIINGNMSAKRSLTLTLLPKRTGTLEIPAIRIGKESTQPLVLEVTEQSQKEAQVDSGQVMVELSLSKSKAYIEEEVILTLKLFQAPGIRAESLDQPQTSMPDTQLKLLSEESYRSERNAIDYRVMERTYAVYAYQSGNLEIGGVKYRGRSGGDRLFSFFNDPFNSQQQDTRFFRTESNKVSLEVMPIPESFTGDRWLPAKNLQVVESGLAQQMPIIAGKPLTRRIMVLADGLTESQLPSIEQKLPSGIKLYEERPQLKETPARTGISSSRQIGMTLIATEPGRYDLPGIEIPWWNTETDSQETARLPAVTIDVLPNPNSTPGIQQPQPQSAREIAGQDTATETIAGSDQTTASPDDEGSHWLVWLFGIAWLATLFAWWYTRRSDRPRPQPATAADDNREDPGKLAIDEAIQRLEKSYAEKDAVAARSAWLEWAQLRWTENPPHNLTRLATRCDKAVAEAVHSLERALYSPMDEPGWADYEVRMLIDRMNLEKQPEKQPEGLVPLNP